MKKRQIDPYTRRLLRDHGVYIVSIVVFGLLLLVYLPTRIRAHLERKSQVVALGQEIASLAKKQSVVASFDPTELDDLIAVLDTLVPPEEDYMSSLLALEALSAQSGFGFLSYSSPFGQQQREKVTLTVDGIGTAESFLAFMEMHTYQGRRLVTVNDVNLGDDGVRATLEVTFYNKNIEVKDLENIGEVNKTAIDFVRKAVRDVPGIGSVPDGEASVSTYTPRSNPFGP